MHDSHMADIVASVASVTIIYKSLRKQSLIYVAI